MMLALPAHSLSLYVLVENVGTGRSQALHALEDLNHDN
jgi:hypothetical protein